MSQSPILTPNARPWLPRTGQTVTAPTANYRTGDDGYFQAGRPGTTRFVDNGNGTIFDRHTGLTWVKQPELIIPGAVGITPTNQIQAARGDWANATVYAAADLVKDTVDSTYWVCAVGHTSAAGPTTFAQDRAANPTWWRQTVWTASAANLTTPATMNWNGAIDNSLALVTAGFTDWRLPNYHELSSLLDVTRSVAPLINLTFFPNTKLGYYWASSTSAWITSYAFAWRGDTNTGGMVIAAKTETHFIRPVRGGRTILG